MKVTYVPEDDDEKEGDSRQTTHGFTPGDVFMVFEYVDYDLSGLLKCRDVVSGIEVSAKHFLDFCNFLLSADIRLIRQYYLHLILFLTAEFVSIRFQ